MKTFPFQKHHRLTLKKEIEDLFKQGKSFRSGVLRLVYHISTDSRSDAKVLITIPRKKFRKATDRNRIRRLIREAYRLNRTQHIPDIVTSRLYLRIGFIYAADSTVVSFNDIEESVTACLKKLSFEIKALVNSDSYLN